MDSSRSSDVSSSMAEFLEKEKFCQDPHKRTDVAGTNTHLVGTVSAHERMNSSSSDEEIGNLLKQMRQLLSPGDLDYLEANEGRTVEELLKEAEALVQITSPLFKGINVQASCTESANSGWVNSPPKSEDKSPEPLSQERNDDSENENIHRLMQDMEDLANVTSTLLQNPVVEDKIEESDISSKRHSYASNDIAQKESETSENDEEQENISLHSGLSSPKIPINEDIREHEVRLENSEVGFDSNKEVIADSTAVSNIVVEDCIKLAAPQENEVVVVEKTSPKENMSRKLLRTNNRERLSLSDLEVPETRLLADSLNTSPIKNIKLSTRNDTASESSKLRNALEETEKKYLFDLERLQASYEEKVRRLQEEINILNAKVKNYEIKASLETGAGDHLGVTVSSVEHAEVDKLKAEINSQEQLISGYQRENHKLFKEISAAKEQWKKEKGQLEAAIRSSSKAGGTNHVLQEQLQDARETILRYQLELERYKTANMDLEEECSQLRSTVSQLEVEADGYRRQLDIVANHQTIHTASSIVSASTALTQQLAEARTLLAQKEFEMAQLNNELSGLRSQTSRTKKQADLSLEINSLKVTVTQLQSALSIERKQNKTLARDKDVLMRENSDLKRQVKEVEGIIKQRNKPDSSIASIVNGEGKVRELEEILSNRQAALIAMQEQLEEMKVKYDDHITELENRLTATQEENKTLKQHQNEYVQKDNTEVAPPAHNIRKSNSFTSRSAPGAPAAGTGGKEDAHLLATIRGIKMELSSKDKDIMRLNRDLEDARKTNRRLQREREKQLKTAPPHKPSSSEINILKGDNKSTSIGGDLSDSTFGKPYNPTVYQEEKEAVALMRMENKSLREEAQRLGQDILTLHNKRLQDLRSLQSEHEQEIQRLLNDYSTRHSQTTVAELQGQIYTQQMVITHLKEQLKQLTLLKEENAMLKLERDHLEKALMGANKKVQELTTPEAQQYQHLLEKFENLERRHEVRERKLQSIVRDLLARSSEPVPCGPVCRNKLLDKNREICYYRVEMDKILEALREFKRSK